MSNRAGLNGQKWRVKGELPTGPCLNGHVGHWHFEASTGAPRCRLCQRQFAKKWKVDNPERFRVYRRRSTLKRLYGITQDWVEARWIAQGQCCAVCYEYLPLEEVPVDHDHVTGKVRGLVCNGCNLLLGRIESKKGVQCLDYLARHSAIQN